MFVMYRIFTSGNVITFEVVFPKVAIGKGIQLESEKGSVTPSMKWWV
jgi:hypothetical protein